MVLFGVEHFFFLREVEFVNFTFLVAVEIGIASVYLFLCNTKIVSVTTRNFG